MKTDNRWLARYTENALEANYNLWVMGVPRNPATGLPTVIGWQEAYPPGSLSHLSNYEEKMIRLLAGSCTREEAYHFLRRGNELFDSVFGTSQQTLRRTKSVSVSHSETRDFGS